MHKTSSLTVLAVAGCVLFWPAAGAAQSWADRLKGAVPGLPITTETSSETATSTIPLDTEYDMMVAGLREALGKGALYAVETAGQSGGFLDNPRIRIPMPGYLNDASSLIRGVGLGRYVDEFEVSMNRAAEQAVPLAAPLLAQAISEMSIDDARSILVGAPDSATRYLRRTTGESLKAELQPLVTETMQNTGVTNAYTQLSEQVTNRVPTLERGSSFDINQYVTGKTLDGLFALIAVEEQKIRSDPAARTTDLLRQVFGG